MGELCKQSGTTNFFKSLASQVLKMAGVGSVLDHTGLNAQSDLQSNIQKLQDKMKSVEWQSTQRLIVEETKTISSSANTLRLLQTYMQENMNYVDLKYIYLENDLGFLDSMLNILTTLVVFVIIYFLKFK